MRTVKQALWLVFALACIVGGWLGLVAIAAHCGWATRTVCTLFWVCGTIALGWNLYDWSPDGRRMSRRREE
jgi:hypothetical protein